MGATNPKGKTTQEYQEQIKRWWDLEVLLDKAMRAGMWMEAVSLAYVLLELRMRLLLRTKKVSTDEIDAQKYLMSLVAFAETKGHLDANLAQKLRDFNNIRRDAIHGLVQGRIEYKDIESAAHIYSRLTLPLQEAMGIKITLGPVETYEDYLREQKKRGC